MGLCMREPGGGLKLLNGFALGRPDEEENIATELLLGGEGLFGTLRDYLAFLRAILQCDPRYSTSPAKSNPNSNPKSKAIVSSKSYEEMFKPSLSNPSNLVTFTARAGYLDPPPTNENINHSVALAIRHVNSVDGRKKGSGFWSGMAKTQYWIDPEVGLAVSEKRKRSQEGTTDKGIRQFVGLS